VPGILAIVGRPNVGKSALFNRIVGRRIAIVHDQPGVTRDRVMAEAEWHGHSFTVIDTGGIGLRPGEKSEDIITRAALDQVDLAVEAADAVLLVVNVQEGQVPLDLEVGGRLRSSGKPVLVVANKADNEHHAAAAVDFASLGFSKVYPVSAIHGRGLDVLLQAAVRHLPEESASRPSAASEDPTDTDGETQAAAPSGPLKLAIIGRPNVGKSSIINAITQSNRVVVSPIPGTTRDAVDVPFEVTSEGRKDQYVLVDTAGVRKRRRIDNSVEFFSVKRTEEAIERCDVAVLVLDAGDGIMEQDKKIGAMITEARRACIVVVNKWDLVADQVRAEREKEMARRPGSRAGKGTETRLTTLGEFGAWVQEKLFFLDYAPVIFASAHTGFHLDRLLEAVRYVGSQMRQEVPTAVLNRTLRDAVTRRQPVSSQGTVLRFFYATQIGQAPPRFVLFINRPELFNRNYDKYLVDSLRTAFGFEGCPLILSPRARPKTVESVRKNPGGKKPGRKSPAHTSSGPARTRPSSRPGTGRKPKGRSPARRTAASRPRRPRKGAK
jgi:GTP-binding protein